MKRFLYSLLILLIVVALQFVVPQSLLFILNSITGTPYHAHSVSTIISFSSFLFCSFAGYVVGKKLWRNA
jgi:hypothetical protein